MKWKISSARRRCLFSLPLIGFLCLLSVAALGQRVSLELLRQDGYGVVRLLRPRPNALTVLVDINGWKHRLLVDTGWPGDGVGLLHGEEVPTRSITTGSQIPIVTGGAIVTLGNVQLSHVPILHADRPALASELSRRTVGADGVIGVGFLRTCSAFVDLENLRLYLRPPDQGRRVKVGRALTRLGLAAIPFQRTSHDTCLIAAEVNGVDGEMLIDTGAYLSLIDRALTQTIHARPVTTTRGHPRPRTQDEFAVVTRIEEASEEAYSLIANTRVTPLRSFALGGVPVRAANIRLGALDLPAGTPRSVIGRLGVDILGSNGAIIDFAENDLLLRPK